MALLAVPVVHAATTSSQPPKWIGLDNYIRMFTDDPIFMQSAQITLIYVLVGTPITLAAALGVAMLLNYRDQRRRVLPLRVLRPVADRRDRCRSRSCGGRCSTTDGPVDNVLSAIGIDLGGWVGNPDLVLPDDDPARGLAVRRHDGDLPRRPQADPQGAVRGGRDGRRRRLAPVPRGHPPDAVAR